MNGRIKTFVDPSRRDGWTFVPNFTLGPLVQQAIRCSTGKPLNVHLMIVELERYLAAFAEDGGRPERGAFKDR
jgi:pentose-5-phosphate-3-epimerase